MFLIVIIVTIIIIAVPVELGITFMDYKMYNGTGVKLSYRLFKNLYDLDPTKWSMIVSTLHYYKDSRFISVQMNFIDFCRMRQFMNHEQRIKKQQEQDKTLQEILADMQKNYR